MNWTFLAEVVPRTLDYAADLGVAAVVAYAIAIIPIVLGPFGTRARVNPATPRENELDVRISDLERA